MLIPYNTDAPLYHYPISTVTLIVVNVIFFFTFCSDSSGPSDESGLSNRRLLSREAKELFDGLNRENLSEEEIEVILENFSLEDELPATWRDHLILQFGQGLRPWQWLTSMFMHLDIFHLLGNMFFLWAFGLILEGKLGWWRFAGLYLIMGILQAMIVQVLMLFSYGAALGASGAIFALLALVVIFAPSNIFETLLLIGLYPITIEISTLIFGFIFVVINCLGLFFQGGTMSSELLHMIGFGIGLPIGFIILLRGLVDCEGYDIVSYFQGKEGKESTVGKKKKGRAKSLKAESEPNTSTEAMSKDLEKKQAMLLSQIDEAIAGGNYDLAVAMQRKMASHDPGCTWRQPQLMTVIQHYVQNREYEKAAPLIEHHIAMFEAHQFKFQSLLLKIWLQDQRPRHALRFMQSMDKSKLTEAEMANLRGLAQKAKTQIQEGVVELE